MMQGSNGEKFLERLCAINRVNNKTDEFNITRGKHSLQRRVNDDTRLPINKLCNDLFLYTH